MIFDNATAMCLCNVVEQDLLSDLLIFPFKHFLDPASYHISHINTDKPSASSGQIWCVALFLVRSNRSPQFHSFYVPLYQFICFFISLCDSKM